MKEEITDQMNEISTNEENKDNLEIENESMSLIQRVKTPFAPKIKIEEKLIGNEKQIEYALVKYYSATQIIAGLILLALSFLLIFSVSTIFILVTALSVLLLLTGYEIEEIYITSERLLVRRIGLFERLIRIPSDEEHVLKHIVSFTYGRAPFQLISVILGSIGILSTVSLQFNISLRYILLITALGLFFFGLRLNKRVLTLNLAGGHYVLLGTRKGVPKRIITALMSIILTNPNQLIDDQQPQELYNDSPMIKSEKESSNNDIESLNNENFEK